MTDETTHIATAAALDDPYAALNQHLHGDGEKPHKYSPDHMMTAVIEHDPWEGESSSGPHEDRLRTQRSYNHD